MISKLIVRNCCAIVITVFGFAFFWEAVGGAALTDSATPTPSVAKKATPAPTSSTAPAAQKAAPSASAVISPSKTTTVTKPGSPTSSGKARLSAINSDEPGPATKGATTGTTTAAPSIAANGTLAEDVELDWGVNPLSEADLKAVMTWIAAKMAAEKLPYCYRQSYDRGVGDQLSSKCEGDLVKDSTGLLCYPKCNDGYKGVGPVCWGVCPDGFKDIGAFCQKPDSYGRGGGYPWKFGDPVGNLDNARKRCVDDGHPEGCETDGAIVYPKCKAGFHKVGCCVCSPDCPKDFADTGTGCTKPSYGRGAGKLLACDPGLERDGVLCYKPCKQGFHGIGPLCWQNCPSQEPTECGAGCTLTTKDCVIDTGDMVISPIMMAVDLASFGGGSAATNAVRGAEEGAKTAQAAQKIAKASKLKALYKDVKNSYELLKAKGYADAGAAGIRKSQIKGGILGVKIVKGTAEETYDVSKEVRLFSNTLADDFANQTTQEISDKIDATFGPRGRDYVKSQWGAHQLATMATAEGWGTAENVVSMVSVVDISGVTGCVSAFLHPVCENNMEFPTVHPFITD